ncbi:MAG: hypothetical protein R3E09_07045 [Novosphingobium sp.]
MIDRKGKPTSLARCTQVIDINLIGTSNILPEFAVRGLALEPDASGECGKDRGVGLKLPAVRELAQDQDQGVDVCMDCDSKDGREKYMAGWRPMF